MLLKKATNEVYHFNILIFFATMARNIADKIAATNLLAVSSQQH